MIRRDQKSWFARRGISRVIHFHCDHFEPGRKDGSGALIGYDHACRWMDKAAERPWAANASIFYKSMWLSKKTPEQAKRCKDKGIPLYETNGQAFAPHSQAAMDEKVVHEIHSRGFDFHPHIHHEHWCSGQNMPEEEWDGRRDGRRLEDMIKWLLKRYKDMGVMKPTGWGFIHGAWALNASDLDICQIKNEIEILHRNGCVADFSFPSGRPWCDPWLKVPHTVNASGCFGNAGYRNNKAEPSTIEKNHGVTGPLRFLIWNQECDHNWASMDNLRNNIYNMGKDTAALADRACIQWISSSWVYKGTMFLKTHAHSLWHEHWANIDDQTSSLLSDVVTKTFRKMENHANRDGITVEYWNVRQVLKHLKELDQ